MIDAFLKVLLIQIGAKILLVADDGLEAGDLLVDLLAFDQATSEVLIGLEQRAAIAFRSHYTTYNTQNV